MEWYLYFRILHYRDGGAEMVRVRETLRGECYSWCLGETNIN